MYKKVNIVVLSGVVCSGKTTYRKKSLRYYKVVSFDDLIMKYFGKGKSYTKAYKLYLKNNKNKILNLKIQKQLKLYITRKNNIVIDLTNIKQIERKMLVEEIPNFYKKILNEPSEKPNKSSIFQII